MGAEAFRTQGKAKLRIEGQSLGRTRLLPKITAPRSRGSHSQLSREIWARTCQNRGSHPLSSAPRTPAETHYQSKAGRPCEGICCLFSPFCVCSASPPFPAPAMPWLRRFSTSVRGQLPPAIPPHTIPLAPHSHRLRGPFPPGARSACAPYTISTPIPTITVMISTITSAVTTVNTTVSCHLDKAGGPQDTGKEPKFSGMKSKVQVDYSPENKERRLLERKGKWRREREPAGRGTDGVLARHQQLASCLSAD